MRTFQRLTSPLPLLCVTLLAGCAVPPSQTAVLSTQGSTLVQTGYVTEVRSVTLDQDQAPGVGAVVGAVLGGLVGNNIGGGDGRTLATVGGAVAGGVAGHQIEKSRNAKTVTALSVRFQNGEVRTYQVEPGEAFRIGDRVKLSSNNGQTRITH